MNSQPDDLEETRKEIEEFEDDKFPPEDWYPEVLRPGGWLSGRLIDACAPRQGNLLWWMMRRPLLLFMNDYVMVGMALLLGYGMASRHGLLTTSVLLLGVVQILGCTVLAADLPRRLRKNGLAPQLFVSPVEDIHFEQALGSVLECCLAHTSRLLLALFVGERVPEAVQVFHSGEIFGPDGAIPFVAGTAVLLVVSGIIWIHIIGLLYVLFWSTAHVGLWMLGIHAAIAGLGWLMIYDAPLLALFSIPAVWAIALLMKLSRYLLTEAIRQRALS